MLTADSMLTPILVRSSKFFLCCVPDGCGIMYGWLYESANPSNTDRNRFQKQNRFQKPRKSMSAPLQPAIPSSKQLITIASPLRWFVDPVQECVICLCLLVLKTINAIARVPAFHHLAWLAEQIAAVQLLVRRDTNPSIPFRSRAILHCVRRRFANFLELRGVRCLLLVLVLCEFALSETIIQTSSQTTWFAESASICPVIYEGETLSCILQKKILKLSLCHGTSSALHFTHFMQFSRQIFIFQRFSCHR